MFNVWCYLGIWTTITYLIIICRSHIQRAKKKTKQIKCHVFNKRTSTER